MANVGPEVSKEQLTQLIVLMKREKLKQMLLGGVDKPFITDRMYHILKKEVLDGRCNVT